MTIKKLIYETIAGVQHQIWADWMMYLFSVCIPDDDGSLTIPCETVNRWLRQINTPYRNLSEKEKDSDREQVDKIIRAFADNSIDIVIAQTENNVKDREVDIP